MSNIAVSQKQTTMTDGMTGEQALLFLRVARIGVACGLTSPYEWYLNYTKRPQPQVRRAFANFFRGCASCREEADALYLMEDREVIERFRSGF